MTTTSRCSGWAASCAASLALAAGPVAAPALEETERSGPATTKALEPETLPGAFGQRFSIQEENDVFGFTSKTDRYYTQGLRVSARWAPGRRVFLEGSNVELWGFELGQNIYTPTSITETDLAVLQRDRPYAGYLYAGLTVDLQAERLNAIPAWLRLWHGAGEGQAFSGALHVALRYGQTGPAAAAGAVQTGFHYLLRAAAGNDRQDIPQGWGKYEVSNLRSVDATVEYSAEWVRLSWLSPWARTGSQLALRVAPRARLDVGGVVDAAGLGMEARLGLLRAGSTGEPSRPPCPLEAYLWGGAHGRFVAYSRFIEGHLIGGLRTEVRPARWVGELIAGAAVRYRVIEVVAAQVWRTQDIRPVPDGASAVHNYGSFQVSFLFE
jgi:hypothetical protein